MVQTYAEWAAPAGPGLQLHARRWLPAGPPRAVVQLVHGVAEHAGRYGHVAEALCARGLALQAFDLRSHGRSNGQPRAHLPDLEAVIADVRAQLDSARAFAAGRPVFLYGHSLGAFLALLTLLRHPRAADGFVSSATPLDADRTVARPLLWLAALLGRLAPRLPLVPMALEAISRDPEVVFAYREDPLVHAIKMRARTCAVLNAALRRARPRLGELRLPLLVLHGSEDRIAPPSGSQRLYDAAGSTDKTLRVYPGLWHEVHNEPEQAQVLADLGDWLVERSQ